MLMENNISAEELYEYVLYSENYNDELNMEGYHIGEFYSGFTDDSGINLVINFKSNESTLITEFKINNQLVSMDCVIVKTFIVPFVDFNIFQRGKKINKLKNGLL